MNKADFVYLCENIYTVTGECIRGGIAVKNGIILKVCEKDKITEYCDKNTVIYDFGNHFLMPGFIDGHTHIMANIPKVDLSSASSIDDCKALVKDFYEKHKDMDIIIGEKWYAANLGGILPTKYDIDEIIKDVPFYASDLDLHMVWCNSVLLNEINKVSDGILVDKEAMDVIVKYKVPDTIENIKSMLDIWTEYGVTAVNGMDFYNADENVYKIIKELLDNGQLNVRVFASLDAKEATDKSIEYAKSYMNSDMFRLNALKVFLDGTGSGHTAYMKRKYFDKDTKGACYLNKEKLIEYINLAYKHGLAMHTHSCGDRAVQIAIDTYNEAFESGIESDYRYSIEHLDTIDSEELNKLEKMNKSGKKLSANLTPDFLAPTNFFENNPYLKVFDHEDRKKLWKIKSIINTGINVSFGTDYTASSMNPFVQIYRAITREANDGKPALGYHPEEKINISEAIMCYTLGSANSIGMEDKLGSIEEGKYADFIVLDRDITKVAPLIMKDTKVLVTIVGGKIVYRMR